MPKQCQTHLAVAERHSKAINWCLCVREKQRTYIEWWSIHLSDDIIDEFLCRQTTYNQHNHISPNSLFVHTTLWPSCIRASGLRCSSISINPAKTNKRGYLTFYQTHTQCSIIPLMFWTTASNFSWNRGILISISLRTHDGGCYIVREIIQKLTQHHACHILPTNSSVAVELRHRTGVFFKRCLHKFKQSSTYHSN